MRAFRRFESSSDYTFYNDLNDFSMPYQNAGSFDVENMKYRYKGLHNEPRGYLHKRLQLWSKRLK